MGDEWYGIEGIRFIYRGPWSDPEIDYKGVTDSTNIDIEEMMWRQYLDESGDEDDYDAFAEYMQVNADFVKDMIEECRLAAVRDI